MNPPIIETNVPFEPSMLPRSASPALIAMLAMLCACSSAADGSESRGEVIGGVSGESIAGAVVTSTVLREAGAPLAPGANQRLQIFLGEGGAVITSFCPDFATDTSKVVLLLDVYAPTVGAAEYNICAGSSCEAPYAQANWSGPATGSFGVDAVSGSVTLTEIDTAVVGSFTLMFGSDAVSGQFNSPLNCHDERGEGPPVPLDEACQTSACTTHDYAMNVVSYPQLDENGLLPGFDLDGTSDTICGQMDATSPAPHTRSGVDNAAGPTLASRESGSLQTKINAGELVELIRIEGVDDFQNDDRVRATLLVGRSAGTLTHGAFGHFLPDQQFIVWASSYLDDAHTQPRFSSMEGSIVDGVVLVHAAQAPFLISFASDAVGAALLENARIEVPITAEGLGRGLLGGSIDISHFLTATLATPQLAAYASTYETLLRGFADLNPDASGNCQSASLAQEFDAVSASINPGVLPNR